MMRSFPHESFARTLISLLGIIAFFRISYMNNQTWFYQSYITSSSLQHRDTTACQYLTPEYDESHLTPRTDKTISHVAAPHLPEMKSRDALDRPREARRCWDGRTIPLP
jgi:hypothetical protein